MKQDTRAAVALRFLRELKENNHREWFNANRPLYDDARAAFESMVAELILRLAAFDAEVSRVEVKDTTYRIYRDTRFSPDKTPYKTHLGAYINPRGKKSWHGGYYFHLEPDNCLVAGGAYCLPSNILRPVRQAVFDGIDEFRAIVEAPAFKKFFPVIGGNRVKTAPQGFPKDFPYIDYLRPRDYSCYCPIDEQIFAAPAWLDVAEEAFRTMKPFLDFINFTIDDYE